MFLFIWLLTFLTGYLDIFELFLYHDNEVINVRVIKKVSKRKKYRVDYKLNDEKYEDNDILDKNGKNEAIDNINNCNFPVKPKTTEKENIGCNYCKFSDICFKENKDLEYISFPKDLSFLGGDIDA